jgi:hypothetical protein
VLTHASVSCCRKKRVKALYFIGYLYYGGEGDLNPGSAKTSLYKGNCRYRLYYGEL